MGGGAVTGEAEGGGAALHRGLRVVRQVHHLVVCTVVRHRVGAVEYVAFHHAALRQVAVVVQSGVIGLVIGGCHAVADGLRRRGGHHAGTGQSQRGGQSQRAVRMGTVAHKNAPLNNQQMLNNKKLLIYFSGVIIIQTEEKNKGHIPAFV